MASGCLLSVVCACVALTLVGDAAPLVSSGYLKVASPIEDGTCVVRLPNGEIRHVFKKGIVTKLRRNVANATDITGDLLDRFGRSQDVLVRLGEGRRDPFAPRG